MFCSRQQSFNASLFSKHQLLPLQWSNQFWFKFSLDLDSKFKFTCIIKFRCRVRFKIAYWWSKILNRGLSFHISHQFGIRAYVKLSHLGRMMGTSSSCESLNRVCIFLFEFNRFLLSLLIYSHLVFFSYYVLVLFFSPTSVVETSRWSL